MNKMLKAIWNDKRGNVLVLVGASLPMLVGAAGLATDTIQWTLWNRQLQRAADSAAIAGVYAQQAGVTVTDAVSRDLGHTQQTGISLLSLPVVTHPTVTGYTNVTKVDLEIQKALTFSSMFMTTAPVIRASATAGSVPGGDYCLVSLEEQPTTGLYFSGTSNLSLGCGMITNASDVNEAAYAKNGVTVTASEIAAVGGINTTSPGWTSGTTFRPYTTKMTDPFESVNPNAPTSCSGGAVSNKKNDTTSISPGCYSSFDIKGVLNMAPGTYYVNGGDFNMSAGADVRALNGVTIVFTNTNTSSTATIGHFKMNGQAKFQIEAPDSGNFAGIAVYQDRRATDDGTSASQANSPNKFNGGSGSKVKGAFYFPNQQFTFNGSTGIDTQCAQFVAKRAHFTGSADLQNVCPAGSASGSFSSPDGAVRLIS